jgi:hypothetical protein
MLRAISKHLAVFATLLALFAKTFLTITDIVRAWATPATDGVEK